MVGAALAEGGFVVDLVGGPAALVAGVSEFVSDAVFLCGGEVFSVGVPAHGCVCGIGVNIWDLYCGLTLGVMVDIL